MIETPGNTVKLHGGVDMICRSARDLGAVIGQLRAWEEHGQRRPRIAENRRLLADSAAKVFGSSV
jgi:hypothetical protein